MEEATKNRIFFGLVLFAVLFFIISVGSCSSAYRMKQSRDKEMVSRLDLEERMSKFNQEKAALVSELKTKDKELQDKVASLEATKKALVQEQLMSTAMKDELVKVTKLKEALEAKLKEPSVSVSKPKKNF
jgi:TolA-binding protein